MSILLPLLLAVSPPAAAFSPDELADARCLVAFSMLPPGSDGKPSQAGVLGSFYFYGKMTGRNPALDLEAALRAVAADAKANGAKYFEPCRQEVIKRSEQMIEAGKALTAVGL